ncbi:hypothetical protein F2Q70_00025863 [Brassica cretica]|uniref:Uncharacterized protein n=1 Tax=Brassica cretica TaxID=69181 RepID=A0A8S9LCP3_BRACR|nr:hypothetical protein F2Q70_00025863 [Brassica cretica]
MLKKKKGKDKSNLENHRTESEKIAKERRRRPRARPARSLRSNRARAEVQLLCSDRTLPNIDTTSIHAFSSNLRMLSPEDRSKLSPCNG